MDAVKTFDVQTLRVEIHIDDMCPSPREWDNLGIMVGTDSRRVAPDREPTTTETCALAHQHHRPGLLERFLRICEGSVAFSEWDGGFAYVTNDRCNKLGVDPSDAAEQLKLEIDVYEEWSQGECYGYVIRGEDGDIIDSCWGFIGGERCEQEARHASDYLLLSDLYVDAVPIEGYFAKVAA